MSKKYPNILVIPDSHACPYHDLKRYTRLGRWASRHSFDYIVDMGDWADMHSLSSYDKGTRKHEGARVAADFEAAVEARDRFYMEYSGRAHKIALMGNHEHRISRAANIAPELYGYLSLEDLQCEEYGWEVVPFQKYKTINGVSFSHYFTGTRGKALDGSPDAVSSSLAKKLTAKSKNSIVVGHSHTSSYATRADTITGKTVHGLVCGYFGHPDSVTDERGSWATGFAPYWRFQVCVLKDVDDGQYGLEIIPAGKVK